MELVWSKNNVLDDLDFDVWLLSWNKKSWIINEKGKIHINQIKVVSLALWP